MEERAAALARRSIKREAKLWALDLVIRMIDLVLYETVGPDWMTPDRFRFGTSSLLNDMLMQIRKERTGRYSGGDYFTID